jgi:two-component system chemotaxis response regulator CheB
MSGSRQTVCNQSDLIARLRLARLNAVKMREEALAVRARILGSATRILTPSALPHVPVPESAFLTRPFATQLLTIGGSAGALDDAITIIGALPALCGAAVAIAFHASAATLVQVLRHRSRLPVKWAESSDVLRAGCIYVVPANHHLIVNADMRLTVSSAPRLGLFRPSIDWLFHSAAVAFNERHMAVILSGRLNDGAAGACSVARCGGTVYAQDPESCAFPDMPRAAIKTGCISRVLPIRELAEAVVESIAANAAQDAGLWAEPFAS